MHTARDVADVLESIAPPASGVPGDLPGFCWGDPMTPVAGVACMWNVQTTSLAAAAQRGLNMVVCHEALWLAPQTSPWYVGPDAAHIRPNALRRDLLQRHGFVVYRTHSNWDALPADGVADQAVAALQLEGLSVVGRQKFFSICQLPAAMTVADLGRWVAGRLGFGQCRLFGDAGRPIRRFCLLIGGFGENQFHMPQAAMEMGAEAIILGEMSEFIVIGALEMGLPVIETLHSISESPAIRRQAALLADRLPGLPVQFIPSGAPAFSPAGPATPAAP